jgi:hypothetical protein
MCNFLHPGAQSIPEFGIGYKVFNTEEQNNFRGWLRNNRYELNNIGKYMWSPKYTGNGFTFFLDKNEAIRFYQLQKKLFTKTTLCKIYYEDGLGTHLEDNIMSNQIFQIALCKQFVIIDTVEVVSDPILQNILNLVSNHSTTCLGKDCDISLILVRVLVEKAGYELTDEQRKVFR